jgi:hypothetical protein
MMEVGLVQLKAPTVQHFSTLFGGSEGQMRNKLSKGQSGGSGVSYEFVRTRTIFDAIQLRQPFGELRRSITMMKGELNVQSNLGVLEALERYIHDNPFSGAVRIERSYFPIARGLLVPVNPPLVLIHSTAPVVLWPSFWKTPGRMNGLPSAIFGSILEREIFARTDFRELELEFLDLSSPDGTGPRSLRIYRRAHFPTLTDAELKVEMDKFASIFFELKEKKAKDKSAEKGPIEILPPGGMFDL